MWLLVRFVFMTVFERIAGRFGHAEPRARVREYVVGLVAGLGRKKVAGRGVPISVLFGYGRAQVDDAHSSRGPRRLGVRRFLVDQSRAPRGATSAL
jgi:hypothetical protein